MNRLREYAGLIVVSLAFVFLSGAVFYKYRVTALAKQPFTRERLETIIKNRADELPTRDTPPNSAFQQTMIELREGRITWQQALQDITASDAVTKPVFPEADPNASAIENAYKRLEYMKENPYAWGGVHSPRATELIEVLMPPPVLADESHGETVYTQMVELMDQGDPRAAAVIIGNMCDGSFSSSEMQNALVAIGPPAVPYILPYLERGFREGVAVHAAVFQTLTRIAIEYPSDLGGITEHIILPKIARIAADTDFERHDSGTVYFAKKALAQLQ